MPTVEPVAMTALTPEARKIIDDGAASGMLTMALPLQIYAHSPAALKSMYESYDAVFKKGVAGQRIQELIRIRSAQLNGCAPCSVSRKDDSLQGATVCDIDDAGADYTAAERAALAFLNTFVADHFAIGDADLIALGKHFSVPEVVEIVYLCGFFSGGHKSVHIFDLLSGRDPILRTDQGSQAAAE